MEVFQSIKFFKVNSILFALNLVQLGQKKKHRKHMVLSLIFKIKDTYPKSGFAKNAYITGSTDESHAKGEWRKQFGLNRKFF